MVTQRVPVSGTIRELFAAQLLARGANGGLRTRESHVKLGPGVTRRRNRIWFAGPRVHECDRFGLRAVLAQRELRGWARQDLERNLGENAQRAERACHE